MNSAMTVCFSYFVHMNCKFYFFSLEVAKLKFIFCSALIVTKLNPPPAALKLLTLLCSLLLCHRKTSLRNIEELKILRLFKDAKYVVCGFF